jgi:hypothetical protein
MLRSWACVAILACLITLCTAKITQDQEHTSTAEDLIKWLEAGGGTVLSQQLSTGAMPGACILTLKPAAWLSRASCAVQAHLVVRPVTEGGLRGTLATKDIAQGEHIVLLPHNMTIDIADYTYPGSVRLGSLANCMHGSRMHAGLGYSM